MEIYEIILDDETQGVEAISLVENPAIEENFIALNSQVENVMLSIDDEKRVVIGAILIPEKLIYRRDGDREYNIYFSADTIRKTAEKYMHDKNTSNATYEHQEIVNDVHMMESWLVEDETYDKTRKYGLNVPVGSWVGTMKINNDEMWSKIKNGELKGYSIEGRFANMLVQQSKQENEWESALNELRNAIKSALWQ